MMNQKIPLHVALIPDGNRRWAKQKGLKPFFGHRKSAEAEKIKNLVSEARNLGVKYLSLWGFSTDNWKRNAEEKEEIFKVILKTIRDLREEAHKEKIRFRHIGRKDRLPQELIEEIEALERETKDYSGFNLQLFLDYGGRDEIVRAINNIIKRGVESVNENLFLGYLDTKEIPEPELIIRTGGEKRLSGFMLYQGAYSELYYSDVYFPDFDAKELRKAVEDFKGRKRTFGI